MSSEPSKTNPKFKNVHYLDSQKSHDELDMLARNRLSNVSFFVCSAGELVILAVLAGILVGIHADRDTESNTRAFSIVCAYSAGVWSKSSSATITVRPQLTRSMSNSACWDPLVLHRAASTRSTAATRYLVYNDPVRDFYTSISNGTMLIPTCCRKVSSKSITLSGCVCV